MVLKSNNLLNKSIGYEYREENIFSDFYLIGFIILLAIIFVRYTIYYYSSKQAEIENNSSFYGEDINLYEPLFNEQANTINDCIDNCNQNIICDGITYNSNTQMCSGTKNGIIRNENANYSAWIKPPHLRVQENINKDFTKAILVGYTKTFKTINANKIHIPYEIGHFSYSFNLTIYDFYKNYGSWRHVFHKGTEIHDGKLINYQSWENLIKDFPIQTIGVWLAPFTNNLRIAVTTERLTNRNIGRYPDAFVKKCNDVTKDCYITDMPGGKWVDRSKIGDTSTANTQITSYVEFFDNDLQNIPINTQINITINFRGTNGEVYYDGKLVKVIKLDGIPSTSKHKSNLYVMNDKTFGGEINNLLYYPDSLTIVNVKDIIKLKPNQEIYK